MESSREELNEALYNKFLPKKLDHLHADERKCLEPVLRKYSGVFHDEMSNDFKATPVIEHEIHLEDARPIRRPLEDAICSA
jgi:hypothetical protein